jgi:hypothetical protein
VRHVIYIYDISRLRVKNVTGNMFHLYSFRIFETEKYFHATGYALKFVNDLFKELFFFLI